MYFVAITECVLFLDYIFNIRCNNMFLSDVITIEQKCMSMKTVLIVLLMGNYNKLLRWKSMFNFTGIDKVRKICSNKYWPKSIMRSRIIIHGNQCWIFITIEISLNIPWRRFWMMTYLITSSMLQMHFRQLILRMSGNQ